MGSPLAASPNSDDPSPFLGVWSGVPAFLKFSAMNLQMLSYMFLNFN